MYKGKFDQNSKQSSVDVQELLAQRNSANAQEAARKAAASAKKAAAVKEQPEPKQEAPVKELSKKEAKQAAKAAKKDAKAAKKEEKAEAPAKRKGPRLGGVIFYTLYFMLILVFFGGMVMVLNWLNGWLVSYEAAQPTVKAEAVFQQVFADPDWAALYDAAGVEDTAFEGRDQYVAYMEEKMGSSALTYQETSAGLSGNRKYLVNLNGEKVASFMLEPANKVVNVTDIPNWQLGEVDVFFERQGSIRVQKMNGHTVRINGVALSEDYTIQIATTKAAEEYLPAGTTGVSTCIQELTGLLGTPEVTVFDEKGNQMEVVYDETKGMYIEQTEVNTIPEDLKTRALDAVKAFSLFMIEEAYRDTVAKYFDSSTDTYNTIVKSEVMWMQDNNGYEFNNESVSDYYRYTEDLFSVKVAVSLDVTRKDGTVKNHPVETTLFFEKQKKGWMAIEMTNEDVQEPIGKVRLTFMDGSTVLSSEFYPTDSKTLETPLISVPEGKVFSGWVREEIHEDGSTTLTVVFLPDEMGKVTLPVNSTLEPMVLYALFEDAATTETEGA